MVTLQDFKTVRRYVRESSRRARRPDIRVAVCPELIRMGPSLWTELPFARLSRTGITKWVGSRHDPDVRSQLSTAATPWDTTPDAYGLWKGVRPRVSSSGSSLCRALLLGFKYCSAGTWLHASALNRNAVTPRPGIASAGHWVRCTSPRQSITQPACLDELLAAKVGRAECAIGTGTEMLVRFASVPASAQVRHSHRIVGFGVCHLFSVRPGGGVWGRGVSAGRRQPTTQRSRCVTDG